MWWTGVGQAQYPTNALHPSLVRGGRCARQLYSQLEYSDM